MSRAVPILDRTPQAPLRYADLLAASDGLRLPVHLPGMVSEAKATADWSLDYLFGLHADENVTAEYYADADRRKSYENVETTFGDLRKNMQTDPTKWFLAEKDLDEIFGDVSNQLEPLPVLPDSARHILRLVFFGNDSQSATHFHVRDQAILAHLAGKKRVILAPPETTSELATNSPFGGRPQFSLHGPEAGADALECFQNLVGDHALEVVMEPGDALFIPVHWWHWVEGQGECLSVTTFWRASLREWAFPAPGIRSATAVVLGETAKIVRKAVATVRQ